MGNVLRFLCFSNVLLCFQIIKIGKAYLVYLISNATASSKQNKKENVVYKKGFDHENKQIIQPNIGKHVI